MNTKRNKNVEKFPIKLKKGDTVKIMRGKDKNKEGSIISVVYKKNRVVVENVNIIKKHQKAAKDSKGGIVEKEAPMHVSNVMIVCSHCHKPTRISAKFLENNEKVRVCKKCGEII